jgi:hypothetical protein
MRDDGGPRWARCSPRDLSRESVTHVPQERHAQKKSGLGAGAKAVLQRDDSLVLRLINLRDGEEEEEGGGRAKV